MTNEHWLDELHRRAATSTLLPSVLMADFARPAATNAGKKRKKKPGKQPANRCKQQGQQCIAFFAELCQQAVDPAQCEDLVTPCCAGLGKCSPAGFLACVVAANRQP